MRFDFGALERLWPTSVEEAISSIELRHGERLYAIAFWLFYAERRDVQRRLLVGVADRQQHQVKEGERVRCICSLSF